MSFDFFGGLNNLNIRNSNGSSYGSSRGSFYGKPLSPPSSSRSRGILYPTDTNKNIHLHNPMISNPPHLPRDHHDYPNHNQDYSQTHAIPFPPTHAIPFPPTNNYNIPNAPFLLQSDPYNQSPHRTAAQFHNCPTCASPIRVQVTADQSHFHVILSQAYHDSLSNYRVQVVPKKQQPEMVTAPREVETNERRSYASITVGESNKPNSKEDEEKVEEAEDEAKDDKTTNSQVDDDANDINGFTMVVSSKTKKKAKAEAKAAATLEAKKMFYKQAWGNQRVDHNKQQQHHRNDRHGRVTKDGHDIYSRDPREKHGKAY